MKILTARRSLKRLTSPRSWKRSSRRAFLILFPIAFPLWITAIAIAILLAFARDFADLLATFWNDPPKRRVEYYVTDRLTNVVPLKDANRVTIKRGMGARYLGQ